MCTNPGRRQAARLLVLLGSLALWPAAGRAQVGEVLWEDGFETLDNWMVVEGNGSWGWGNGELQYYSAGNVAIVDLPGEPGNPALRITARQESGPGIVDQWGNPLQYTSGKVSTRARVEVLYGMIEVRVQVPDLDLGGWPAIWLLGNSNLTWPRCGELDMMEMGHKQAFRNLHDTHNGGNGADNSTVNQMAGANAIFYSDDAVTPENPSGAHSLSWDPEDTYARPRFNQADPLAGRFLTYRLYWDEQSLRFTVIDGGQEYDLFAEPFVIGEEAAEFHQPFHLLINLAIGGALTDAWMLGDPGSGLPVSMPLPTGMYVDYVRVHRWNGQGEVHLGPPAAQGGTFGVYTETTPVDGALVPGETAGIYVWEGTLEEGNLPPWEGEACLSWTTTGLGWFGAGIMSYQPVNLFDFGGGFLRFRIRIPANVTFKVGIIDAWGNQSYVQFPAGQTVYGLVRDGEWGQASIPVDEIRGQWIDLRMLSYEFVILEEQGTPCTFAIDDILWTGAASALEEPHGSPQPAGFRLLGNHPNPFNPRTTIAYELTRPAEVRLDILGLDGRRVATLVQQEQAAGLHEAEWSGERHASGVYVYRLQAGGETRVGKCLLLK